MTRHDERSADATDARRNAEEIDRHAIHEPPVSQIELERQIEELRRALAESDAERMRVLDLYDVAPVGYLTLSGQGLILKVNRTASTLLGLGRGELVEQRLSRFIVQEDRHINDRFHAQLVETGEPQTCELRMLKADGTVFWAHLEAAVRPVAGGVPECRVVMSDVTGIGEALRESNELFALFMRHSPIFAYIKAVEPTESRVLQASDNFRQMIGVSGADMVGRTMAELFPADMAAKMTADDWAVVATGEVLTVDEDLNGRNYTSIKFPIVRGDKTLLAGYTIDITDRKRAEADLQQSEMRYRSLFEANPHPMWVFDRESLAFLAVNDAAVAKYGYRRDEFLAMTIADIRPPEDRARLLADVSHIHDDVMDEGSVWRHQRKDGSILDVEIVAHTIDYGRRPARLVLAHDITRRKRAEEEKARLEAQLQQAQKMESVGRLAGGVAHDFNNMLSVILGYAELALKDLDPAESLHADLLAIRAAANRSADLTRQLLAFARKQTVAPTALDLNETVGPMLTMLRRLMGEDIDLVWRPGTNPWQVKVDPSQIDQVLANLCVNARDAIEGVGKVTIETGNAILDDAHRAIHPEFVPGEYVRLAVSDDGCGMDQGTLSHLFEPFFTTKAVGKGTGLGLATVYGIVKQNQGFIDVSSEAGRGTVLTIYLPRHVNEGGRAQTTGAADSSSRGHETILLVEDDPAVLAMTTRMLAGQGYTVLAAGSAAEAIRVVGEHAAEIHLVLTDVVMPDMNGWDLAARLLSERPRLKRLFTSGYTADVIGHHGVLDEGVQFLQKPFSVRDLAAKVREVLDQS